MFQRHREPHHQGQPFPLRGGLQARDQRRQPGQHVPPVHHVPPREGGQEGRHRGSGRLQSSLLSAGRELQDTDPARVCVANISRGRGSNEERRERGSGPLHHHTGLLQDGGG